MTSLVVIFESAERKEALDLNAEFLRASASLTYKIDP